MTSPSAARPGQEQSVSPDTDDMTVRERIVHVAGALFTERGYAATTTRAIAERVGIRQASMYYHFASKEEIFAALLATSLTLLDTARELVSLAEDPAEAGYALYVLAYADAQSLADDPHNLGATWLLPEARSERFADFWSGRRELEHAYARLGAAVAGGVSAAPEHLGAMLIYLPEVIIHRRLAGDPVPTADVVATACLRLCGVDADTVAAIQDRARTHSAAT